MSACTCLKRKTYSCLSSPSKTPQKWRPNVSAPLYRFVAKLVAADCIVKLLAIPLIRVTLLTENDFRRGAFKQHMNVAPSLEVGHWDNPSARRSWTALHIRFRILDFFRLHKRAPPTWKRMFCKLPPKQKASQSCYSWTACLADPTLGSKSLILRSVAVWMWHLSRGAVRAVTMAGVDTPLNACQDCMLPGQTDAF